MGKKGCRWGRIGEREGDKGGKKGRKLSEIGKDNGRGE